MLETPVLFLIFNRVETAERVFERIRKVQPKKLFIAADGPREHVPSDAIYCLEVRKRILSMVDWPCAVSTLFRDKNLGCGVAPAQAITWFFNEVQEGIVLEDDCLPDVSFFYFCEELLHRFRDDEQIRHISGNNFQNGKWYGNGSYYFSIYNHIWGWASWRRSWAHYNFLMPDYNDKLLLDSLRRYGLNKHEKKFWRSVFKTTHKERPRDIWDYQWTYTIWKAGGLSILPNVNIVQNIGFNEQATHTKSERDIVSKAGIGHMDFPLRHPKSQKIQRKADLYTFNFFFNLKPRPIDRLKAFLSKLLPGTLKNIIKSVLKR